MPLNVGRFYTSLFFAAAFFSCAVFAQDPQAKQTTAPAASPQLAAAPTAAEVMRERISKAKAFIAVRNYNAAIYELEQIRRESGDPSVRSVTNVLLMNSYLEQGDYKRAQALLTDYFIQQKAAKPGALDDYSIVAGQIVKGARSQADRYRSLGLSVMDRNLPLEAITDLEKMRETLELVIKQAQELAADKAKTATSLALMEEATSSRSLIARDEYDAKRWRDAVADSREEMASARSVIVNAVDGTTSPAGAPPQDQVAANLPAKPAASSVTETASAPPLVAKTVDSRATNLPTPVAANDTAPEKKAPAITEPAKQALSPSNQTAEKAPSAQPSKKPTERPALVVGSAPAKTSGSVADKPNPAPEQAAAEKTPKPEGPLAVGSLISYATKQSAPIYPAAARAMRASGVVKVEITVDEEGNVADIQEASGPVLLQASARDAIKKWKFRPFVIDGQAVKATGFITFNFSL